MLELSKEDRAQLYKVIESAYPDPDDLRIFADLKLGENLNVIAGGNKYSTVIFNLIANWGIAKGHIEDLILALAKETKYRKDIQQFCARVLQQRLVLNPSGSLIDELNLKLDPNTWGIDINSEELELFLPKQFTFEADVGKLHQGLELANAVCKITFANSSSSASGTGVLIGPELVLTNYHVLKSCKTEADLNTLVQYAQFEFGCVSHPFRESSRTQTMKAAENEPVVAASPIDELDYALIRLNPREDFNVEPVDFDNNDQLIPRSPLNILQHPEGAEMKVSLSNNGVVKTDENRRLVLYVNCTEKGSSGSPCFNNDWKLVALHHKKLLRPFGSIREGILFSAIYTQISSVM